MLEVSLSHVSLHLDQDVVILRKPADDMFTAAIMGYNGRELPRSHMEVCLN